MPDRRQGDRRQGGDRRETPEEEKAISLSAFLITIIALIVVFFASIICIVLSYQKTISELEDNQITDLTLIPDMYNSQDDSAISDNITLDGTSGIENLTLVE